MIENKNIFDINLAIRFCWLFNILSVRVRSTPDIFLFRTLYFIVTFFFKKKIFFCTWLQLVHFDERKSIQLWRNFLLQMYKRFEIVVLSNHWFILFYLRKINTYIYFFFPFVSLSFYIINKTIDIDKMRAVSCDVFFFCLFYIGYGWTNIGLNHQWM